MLDLDKAQEANDTARVATEVIDQLTERLGRVRVYIERSRMAIISAALTKNPEWQQEHLDELPLLLWKLKNEANDATESLTAALTIKDDLVPILEELAPEEDPRAEPPEGGDEEEEGEE